MKKAIATLLLIPTMAMAEFRTGNELLANIDSSSAVENAIALGYVMGVADITRGRGHCAPDLATSGQMRDMVKLFLVKYPEIRHRTADVIVVAVLGANWPCANTNKPKEKNI